MDDIFPKLKREIIKIFPYRATLSRPGRIFSLLLLVGKTKLSKCSIKNGIALRSGEEIFSLARWTTSIGRNDGNSIVSK